MNSESQPLHGRWRIASPSAMRTVCTVVRKEHDRRTPKDVWFRQCKNKVPPVRGFVEEMAQSSRCGWFMSTPMVVIRTSWGASAIYFETTIIRRQLLLGSTIRGMEVPERMEYGGTARTGREKKVPFRPRTSEDIKIQTSPKSIEIKYLINSQ